MAISKELCEQLLQIQNMRRIEEPVTDNSSRRIIPNSETDFNGECWYCGTKRAIVYHGIMCDDCYKGMYGND